MKSVLAMNFTDVWNNPEMTAPYGYRMERVEFDPDSAIGGFSVESKRHQGMRLETEFFPLADGRYLWRCQEDPTSSMDKPTIRYQVHTNAIAPANAIEFTYTSADS